MQFKVSPSAGLYGEVQTAGDKSISHRAIILGAIADGETVVRNILEGDDVLSTIGAFQNMGVEIIRSSDHPQDNNYIVVGAGVRGLQKPDRALDMGNSGTAFRLISGLLCAQNWSSILTGDESLSGRPMKRIITPLEMMGARIDSNDGKPPLRISPANKLKGIEYTPPMASAQVKSAVLLAGLYAQGMTVVNEGLPTRDHMERMLRGFGYPVDIDKGRVALRGGGRLRGQVLDVPADLSSAAFFLLAGLITRGSELLLKKTGVNPSRSGVLTVLKRMGGNITLENQREIGGEPVADIRVKSSELSAVKILGDDIALSIDEIPVIAAAAACARGETIISDAKELRVKESDRIHGMVQGLSALGVKVKEYPDGMMITGGELFGGKVDSFGDHRIAMVFSIAGAAADSPVEILNCENVATSFPNFHQLCRQVGVNIVVNG